MLYHIADRLIGIEGHVGSHDNIGESPEDVEVAFVQDVGLPVKIVHAEFVFDYIQARSAYFARFDIFDQRLGINQASPGRC